MFKGKRNSLLRRHPLGAIIAVLFLISSLWAAGNLEKVRLFDVVEDRETTLAQVLPRMKKTRVVLVGEFHNLKGHHMAQLQIIRAFHESGISLAIGLEMFRAESQHALDSWVSGKITE